MKEIVVAQLKERGVEFDKLADVLYDIQIKYNPKIDHDYCLEMIMAVLDKREVQFAILTGINLDKLAEQNLLDEPLNTLINEDFALYGIDEILALSIVNVYGSIGLTNFGYLDKEKKGIIKEIDDAGKNNANYCSTFLDDIVGAIIAAAASRMAHAYYDNHHPNIK